MNHEYTRSRIMWSMRRAVECALGADKGKTDLVPMFLNVARKRFWALGYAKRETEGLLIRMFNYWVPIVNREIRQRERG